MSHKTGVWQIGTDLSLINNVLKSQENVLIVFGKVSKKLPSPGIEPWPLSLEH